MSSDSLWILGSSRSGKTNRLVEQFSRWINPKNKSNQLFYPKNLGHQKGTVLTKGLELQLTQPGILILAANSDNRRELADKIVTITQGKYPGCL